MSAMRLLVVATLVTLTACSVDAPSDEAARLAFDAQNKHLVDRGYVVIVSFRKADEKRWMEVGTPMYDYQYEAVLAYPLGKTCDDLLSNLGAGPGGCKTAPPGGELPTLGSISFMKSHGAWQLRR